MSKYAVVKIGSSQEKVSVGDVLTVPANFKIESKTPILMSARKGSLITDEKNFQSILLILNFWMKKSLRN